MKFFWKYFFIFLLFITLIIVYFFKTNSGHRILGYFAEGYLSKKTYNQIKVHSLNPENYPSIVVKLQVNDTANVTLKGEVSNYDIDMSYHIVGDSFIFNNFIVKDKIDIEGNVSGSFSSLLVQGEGEAFDGNISYSFINMPKKIKNMNIQMKKVNSQKVLTFLDEKSFVKGFVDIDSYFSLFSTYEKKGQSKIYMNKASFPKILESHYFVLNSTIVFQGLEYKYEGEIRLDSGTVTINNGYYHKSKKTAHVDYKVQLKNLLYFEKILKYKYEGKLNTHGHIDYDIYHNLLTLKGDTEQFGGKLSYIYKNEDIDIELKDVLLEKLLTQFSYPMFFSSNVYGKINFSIKDKIAIVNLDLKNTHFIPSKLTDILYQKVKVNLLSSVYDKSSFSAGYHDSLLSSSLKIDNGKDYILLSDSKIDTSNNKIYSKFEMKIQEQEVFGKIFGSIDNPDIWIDKSKFLQYQTNKKIDSWF